MSKRLFSFNIHFLKFYFHIFLNEFQMSILHFSIRLIIHSILIWRKDFIYLGYECFVHHICQKHLNFFIFLSNYSLCRRCDLQSFLFHVINLQTYTFQFYTGMTSMLRNVFLDHGYLLRLLSCWNHKPLASHLQSLLEIRGKSVWMLVYRYISHPFLYRAPNLYSLFKPDS